MIYTLTDKQVSIILFHLRARRCALERDIDFNPHQTESLLGWKENIERLDIIMSIFTNREQ